MTYSILAKDEHSGKLGCAMATSSMAAGGRVIFAAPSFGIFVVQGRTDPALGLQATRLFAELHAPSQLCEALVGTSEKTRWRQLGALAMDGLTAHRTGDLVADAISSEEAPGVLALGNGLANRNVCSAVVASFKSNHGADFECRLIEALRAGLSAGGEPYPLRSAALKVLHPDLYFCPVDLRVDLSEQPIDDLERYWADYKNMVPGYVGRALDPATAPTAWEIEGLQQPVSH